MSPEDNFSVSDLRRKHEQSQAGGNARPPEGVRETVIDASPLALARPLPGVRRSRAAAEDDEEGQSE